MPRLLLNPDLCTGCRCCELICAFNRYQVNNPRKARLRIQPDKEGIRFQALVCAQCDEPKCVAACPRKALRKNKKGIIVLDGKKCARMLKCVEACPFAAIFFHPETGILKCDLCGACVPNCPNGALNIETHGQEAAR